MSKRRPGVSRWREGVGFGVGHVYTKDTVHGTRRFYSMVPVLLDWIFLMMMIFYCSYRNKFLHAAIYLFGLGIRHYGQEFKHT